MIQTSEILDTLRMIDREKLDVRTITMGISLFPCVSDDNRKPVCQTNIDVMISAAMPQQRVLRRDR